MMMKFLKLGMTSVATIAILTACGGGGGDTTPPASSNKVPTANAGADITVFGTKKVTLDASSSSDVDGSIVEYIWTEGTRVLGKGEKLNNLSFTDGEHTITLTVKDNAGATATDTLTIVAECTMAASVELVKDVNGTVNYVGANEKSEMCYKIDLSSNNGVETYMMYMNLYNGTSHNVTFRNKVKLYDENGAEVHQFYTNYMYKEGNRFKEPFEISRDGTYYLKVYRGGNEATKYGFSIHPSLENGLVQDSKRELNDHFVMAAPITLTEAMADINGSLNMSRTQENSLKNTDNEDYYSIDFANAGTYAFYINLYNGTHHNVSFYAYIEIFDENHASVHKFPSKIYKSGQRYSSTFSIPSSGKYYIKVSRANNEATKYGFSIHPSVANGLVQNSDRELNDFMSMAAPITWSEIDNNIAGSVNVSRKSMDSSIKNTDSTDFYAIDFTTTGTYALDLNLTDGTTSNVSHYVYVVLRNSVGTIEKEFGGKLYHSGQNLNSTFSISSSGVYYLSIYRLYDAAKYTFTIQHP